ncbi:hypothetical protein L596_015914 [Steinernema carpocapsae]|uniref:Uncharacterized protein n=1 Tax=Steinernema carpocapsae TaxID=34508 RepID=A0A4U5NH81_STECR|nr:hypothetical protein L596_015914 [Steinernema carpocapsae]
MGSRSASSSTSPTRGGRTPSSGAASTRKPSAASSGTSGSAWTSTASRSSSPDFVGLRKNSLEDYFFSCRMPYSEPRSLVLELTEHKRLRSSSLLSLEMVAVELVQKLASVISKLVPANREKEVLCEENKQLRWKIENLDAEAIADLEGEVKELNLALMDKQREIEELKKYEEEGEEMVKALEELDVENKELKTQIGQMATKCCDTTHLRCTAKRR